jgi:hypothetical protein
MEIQDVVATVHGEAITVAAVITHLKGNGAFRNAIVQCIETQVIALKCKDFGIKITNEEFYSHTETKRRLLGLYDAIAMNNYCKWHGMTMDQWEQMVQQEVLRQKLKEKVVSAVDLDSYFQTNKQHYWMACLSRIVCVSSSEADEVKTILLAGKEEFATAAKRVSIERNTRIAGGYLGSVKYGTLPPAINQAIFAASPGAILGPYQQNNYWAIYRIEEFVNHELNDTLKKHISDQIFSDWLRKEVLMARA